MNEQRYLEIISKHDNSVTSRLLRFAFRLMSIPYRAVVAIRNRLFDFGLKKIHKVDCPVISIGNVTTGGTGKTPLVAFVVNHLVEQGLHPAIISRGYKSLDGSANDEKRVLEILCPGVPHIQHRDRVASARTAIEKHGCNVIVADDAFQHRRLNRDVNVVLIDALNPWGFGHVLPRGLLRESRSGIRRAEVVVLTRADQVSADERTRLWAEIRKFKANVSRVEVAFEPSRVVSIDGNSKPVAELLAESNGRVRAFCGIGNPVAFRRTIEAAGFTIESFQAFPDHHHYSKSDLDELVATGSMASATVLITTLKDIVKVREFALGANQIWALDIAATFLVGESEFVESVSVVSQRG